MYNQTVLHWWEAKTCLFFLSIFFTVLHFYCSWVWITSYSTTNTDNKKKSLINILCGVIYLLLSVWPPGGSRARGAARYRVQRPGRKADVQTHLLQDRVFVCWTQRPAVRCTWRPYRLVHTHTSQLRFTLLYDEEMKEKCTVLSVGNYKLGRVRCSSWTHFVEERLNRALIFMSRTSKLS